MTVNVGRDFERHDAFENARAPGEHFQNLPLPLPRLERGFRQRPHFVGDVGVDPLVKGFHILEMAEHGAKADTGLCRHGFRAGGDGTSADQRQHGPDNPLAADLAAQAPPVCTACSRLVCICGGFAVPEHSLPFEQNA